MTSNRDVYTTSDADVVRRRLYDDITTSHSTSHADVYWTSLGVDKRKAPRRPKTTSVGHSRDVALTSGRRRISWRVVVMLGTGFTVQMTQPTVIVKTLKEDRVLILLVGVCIDVVFITSPDDCRKTYLIAVPDMYYRTSLCHTAQRPPIMSV